jgi:hypothetical protein
LRNGAAKEAALRMLKNNKAAANVAKLPELGWGR